MITPGLPVPWNVPPGSLTPWWLLMVACVVLVAVACWYAGRVYQMRRDGGSVRLALDQTQAMRDLLDEKRVEGWRDPCVECVTASGTVFYKNSVSNLALSHLADVRQTGYPGSRWFIKLDGVILWDSETP